MSNLDRQEIILSGHKWSNIDNNNNLVRVSKVPETKKKVAYPAEVTSTVINNTSLLETERSEL
jgi:hypothetical protein